LREKVQNAGKTMRKVEKAEGGKVRVGGERGR
jgi:hypothetical protein